MFSNKNNNNKIKMENSNQSKERNIVSQGTKIIGSISSEGDFRIDGILEGDIDVKGKLVVGKKGEVEGKIKASNLDVEGKVKGNVFISNLLFLKNTATINGDIKTSKLSIENGAVFNVNCNMASENNKNIAPISSKK